MSTERDNGYEALQRGDTALAISLLEQAALLEPNDFMTQLYLGAAYGQANRHDEAVNSITRAVQIDPSSAAARFNLGIALEHAGWPNEAITVFQQALVLQPDYPKATEALARLQGATQQISTPPNPAPLQAPQASPQPGGLGSYQSGGESSQPNYGAPPQYGAQPPLSGSQQSLPGTQQPTQAFQPPMGGMPGANAYGNSPYPPANNSFDMKILYEDAFSLKQAALDWIAVLKSPTRFFEEQVDREGLKAPMAMLVLFWLVTLPFTILGNLIGKHGIGTPLITHLVLLPFAIISGLVLALIFHGVGKMFGNSSAYSGSFRAYTYAQSPSYLIGLITALLIPIMTPPPSDTGANPFSGMPQSTSRYETPRIILAQSTNDGQDNSVTPPNGRRGGVNSMPFPPTDQQNIPGMPGSSGMPNAQANPFSNPAMQGMMEGGAVGILLFAIGAIWSFILLVIGLSTIQRTSTGAAVGTIIITNIIVGVLVGMLAVVGGVAIFAALASKGGMH